MVVPHLHPLARVRLMVSKNSCLKLLSAFGCAKDDKAIKPIVVNIVPKMNFLMLVFDIDKELGFNPGYACIKTRSIKGQLKLRKL